MQFPLQLHHIPSGHGSAGACHHTVSHSQLPPKYGALTSSMSLWLYLKPGPIITQLVSLTANQTDVAPKVKNPNQTARTVWEPEGVRLHERDKVTFRDIDLGVAATFPPFLQVRRSRSQESATRRIQGPMSHHRSGSAESRTACTRTDTIAWHTDSALYHTGFLRQSRLTMAATSQRYVLHDRATNAFLRSSVSWRDRCS